MRTTKFRPRPGMTIGHLMVQSLADKIGVSADFFLQNDDVCIPELMSIGGVQG